MVRYVPLPADVVAADVGYLDFGIFPCGMFRGYGKVAGDGMGFQEVECVDAIAAVLAFQVGHRRVEGAIGVVVAVNPMESGAPAKDDVVGGVVGGADGEV